MTTTLHSMRCDTCNGEASTAIDDAHVDRCAACNGFGWTWSDGKAPTFCPSTLTTSAPMACGRYGSTCTGCGRPASEVGTAEDVRTTRAARGL